MSVLFTGTESLSRTGFFGASGDAFTVACWVYPTSLPASGEDRYVAGMTDQILASLSNTGSGARWSIITTDSLFSGTSTVNANEWRHIALVRNGTGRTLYRDAVSEASGTDSATGGTGFFISDTLQARVAAVKVWNAALTAPEIATEMHSFIARRVANLVAWYPWVIQSDQTTDYSGNGRTLTATGTTALADNPPVAWL